MENKLSLRNLLLAGVGSVAYSLEKGMEMIDELVEKGELTVAQGKELNQELRNKFTQKFRGGPDQSAIHDTITNLNLVTKEDLHHLEERISRLEKQLP